MTSNLHKLLKAKRLYETETVFCLMFKSCNFQEYLDMLVCLYQARWEDIGLCTTKMLKNNNSSNTDDFLLIA